MNRKLTTAVTASLAILLTASVTVLHPSVASAALKVTGTTAAASTVAPAVATPLTATDTQLVSLVDSVMTVLERNAPPGAPPGTWKNSGACWRCDAGPALGLAAAAALTNDPARRQRAEAILDTHLAAHQQANGSFGTTASGSDIETMFFANTLGMSAILLKPTTAPARYARWVAAVAGAADFLIANKNLAWYTNGNITLGNSLTMALAGRLTKNSKYRIAYETALAFAVAPPQARWPGYGFVYTAPGIRADGLDGKGYFTEAGVGGLGFDPEYTQVQLDFLAGLYLITGDMRAKMYLNMLSRQLDSRVNKTTWSLDTSGGTRYPQVGRVFPYDTSAVAVLANVGGRAGFAPYFSGQFQLMSKEFISGDGDRLRATFGWVTAMVIMSQPGNARLR